MPAKPARKIHARIERKSLNGKAGVILEAVDQLVDFVNVTLGPKIRHILVDQGFRTELMDDGVSIAQEFELEDEISDAVIAYVREAAQKTDDVAGDGTTSTMVMLRKLLAGLVESSKSYPEARTELEAACLKAVSQLKERSVQIETFEDLLKVARTSMNDEEAAKVVAEVVHKTGPKGAITITDIAGRGISFEKVEGFVMGRGFIARGMINDKERNLYVAPNHNFGGHVAIAVIEELIQSEEHIVPILQAMEAEGTKNLAIFCPNLIGEAMGIVAYHQIKGSFNIVAIPLPGQGEKMKDYVQDICTVTGAKTPVGGFKASDFGRADSIKVSVDDTTIIGGHGEKALIDSAIAGLLERSEEAKDPYDKEYFHQRQARLMGGVVIVKVGGVTDTEIRLRLKKITDAVNACKCALEEGVSPGGGAALLRLDTGSAILDAACGDVFDTVQANAERTDELEMDELRQTVNVLDGTKGDFLEVGVVDATKVLRTAVENAVSIAMILYSTAGIITSKRPE